MKKRFFFKFFLFTVIATMVTFTACKDYDDDIDRLDGKIDNLGNSSTAGLAGLKSDLESSQASLKVELQKLIATSQASADKANAAAAAAQSTADAALKAGGDAQNAADAAQATADAAVERAEAAEAAAATAQETADKALVAGNDAQAAADKAAAAAAAAQADANTNKADIATNKAAAEAAQAAADQAKAAADGAQATADQAKADAAAAQADADANAEDIAVAQAAAQAAQEAADKAAAAAAAAQAAADANATDIAANKDAAAAAKAAADAAQVSADAAQVSADAAQTTANAAKAAAEKAQKAADAAQADADANALDIAANKAAAEAAQKAADAAQEAADNAQTAANKAQGTADKALENSKNNAINIALNAEAAQKAAAAAKAAHNAADLAQNTADNALEVAEGAVDAAQAAADAAQAAADAAKKAQDDATAALKQGADNAKELEEHAKKINTAQAAADAAQKTADAALKAAEAAQEKADKVEKDLTKLMGEVTALEGRVKTLETDVETLNGLIKDLNETVAKLTTENEAAHKALKEQIATINEQITALETKIDDNHKELKLEILDLQNSIDALETRVMELFGKRITSVTLVPTSHINGIAAITFKSLQFTPQALLKIAEQGEYGYAVKAATSAKALVLDGENTFAEFRLSPRYVTKNSIGFPYFESIVSENTTRAVTKDNTGENKPIAPVAGQELNVSTEGILKLQIAKTVETLVASEKNGNTEKFYFASLAIPVADEYLTQEEKENGGAVVTSEHYRIDELITTPRIKSKKAGDIVIAFDTNGDEANDLHYYPYALDADNNPVHFSSATMLYVDEPNHKVDENVVYNVAKDLNELVLVGSEEDHSTIENFADYGISFKFEVATDAYNINGLNQQLFASIDENGLLTSKKATVDGVELSPIGKQPIIKVSLIKKDGANDPILVDVRYIKVKFVSAPIEPVTHNFDPRTADCEDYMHFYLDEDMMQEYFYAPTNLSKEEFLSKYVVSNDNRKDGDIGGIKIAEYPQGPIRWTLTLDQVKENLGKSVTRTFKLVYEDGNSEIEVTLNSEILQPEVEIKGLLNNYWDDNNEYVRFNSREPMVGDINPANNTFITLINNIFETDDAEDVLSLAGYNYSYYFVEDQPIANVTLDNGTVVEITASENGKTLLAKYMVEGVETERSIATINSDHKLEYLKENAIGKELLNKGPEFMKARLGINVTLDCGIEVKVTGLGTGNDDGEFNVHFLRPVNIEGKSAKPFIDAVDFGATGSVLDLKDLVKLSDWRNYAKDTDSYYFDPNNINYYKYYDVSKIDVKIEEITTEGLLIDGQPTTKLPKTIEIKLIGDTDLDPSSYEFEYGALTYRNNGANLIDSFILKVPVTVTYTWGEVTTIVDVEVKKTAASRSIM